jgi:methylmalonyl-CoA/ethylmalonyl-CoA epimerase
MNAILSSTSFNLQLIQIAWVVKDIKTAERFFRDAMGITNFSKPDIIRLADFEGTHYGKPSDAESLVSIAYTDGKFIELIQPVAGHSVFQDYIDKNPAGGIQHIAYSLPVAELDKLISELVDKGYPVVTTVNHPIAKIVFVDTRNDIGIMTEIMGITKEGEAMVQQMKNQAS